MAKPKKQATKAETSADEAAPPGGYASEADFDDTIARNRALSVIAAEKVPSPPDAYRPTNPDMRGRRLRHISEKLHSEAGDALRELGARDLKKELGPHAPDPKRAPVLLERLSQTGNLLTAAEALVRYAKEMDQIALSDATIFLEAANKEYKHAVEHVPSLEDKYKALVKLFDARSEAIIEGIGRAKEQAAAEKPAGK